MNNKKSAGKIGIMADSHDNMPMISRAVELFNKKEVKLVIHAGDIISPITAKEFENLQADLIGVFGNNDGDKLFLQQKFKDLNIGKLCPDHHQFEIEGRKIFLMHEPKFLDALIAGDKCDLIIYGHTHEIDIRTGHPLVVNPGECGGWLNGKCTVCIVDLESMNPEVFDLTKI